MTIEKSGLLDGELLTSVFALCFRLSLEFVDAAGLDCRMFAGKFIISHHHQVLLRRINASKESSARDNVLVLISSPWQKHLHFQQGKSHSGNTGLVGHKRGRVLCRHLEWLSVAGCYRRGKVDENKSRSYRSRGRWFHQIRFVCGRWLRWFGGGLWRFSWLRLFRRLDLGGSSLHRRFARFFRSNQVRQEHYACHSQQRQHDCRNKNGRLQNANAHGFRRRSI